MTIDKIDKLEQQFYEQQKILWKIEWVLENIERTIISAVSIKDVVITQQEKHKVSEARLIELEKELKAQDKTINSLNLKIAIASWAWAVIVFLISKI